MRNLLRLPSSYPHLAEFVVENRRLAELDFLGCDTAKMVLLWVEEVGPRVQRFYVACSKAYVAQWLENHWG